MKKFSVSILCFGVCFLSAAFGSMKPVDVRCGEFFDNPLGYDLSGLSFSWKLPAIRQGIMQTAYRIVVADSEENLEKNPVWDSGKVVSGRSGLKFRRRGRNIFTKSPSGTRRAGNRNGPTLRRSNSVC